MAQPAASLGSSMHARAARLAVIIGLYGVAGLAATGAYIAFIAWLGWQAHDAWGTGGAIATVGASLIATSLLALVAGRVASRTWRDIPRDGAAAPQGAGANIARAAHGSASATGSDPSWNIVLERLLGSRLSAESWVTAASVLAATVAIAGPVRVMRLALRCFVVMRTLRTILDAAVRPPRTDAP